MKPASLAITSIGVSHVARYAIENIERAVMQAGLPGREVPARSLFAQRMVKLLSRAGGLRALRRTNGRAIVVPMMGRLDWTLFPWTYTTEVVPIVFDCLPDQFAEWEQLFLRNRIETAFFTARMVASHFQRALPSGHWIWLPEAIDVEQYSAAIPWADRQVDVLEFGRRYDKYHGRIRDGLAEASLQHLYERRKGELIFPTKAEFIHGLSTARISVCFPQSLTHPERFGAIETLTQRYLESMASGCLLLGRTPVEMADLFGYDPIVPADMDDPVGQIRQIVAHPETHEALRLRNLETVRRDGSWTARAKDLVELLARNGFRPAN